MKHSIRFEEHAIETEDGAVLHASVMNPTCRPRRVIVVSPLVGAGSRQPLLTFRELSRRGAIIVSIEYRGHPRSSGVFDLDSTICDVRHAVRWASDLAESCSVPLHGLAACYGTIPLLHQFGAHGSGHHLVSVATLSGLYQLHQILRLEDFARILSRHLDRDLSPTQLRIEVESGALDCDGAPFRLALRAYLRSLMPELRVQLDSFEALSYARVHMARMVCQFSNATHLDGVRVPSAIPWVAHVGRHDELLGTTNADGVRRYEDLLVSRVPHARLEFADMDHYGRGKDQCEVIVRVGVWFERQEAMWSGPQRRLHSLDERQADVNN